MSLTYALIIFAILLILIFFGVPIAYSIELSVVALLCHYAFEATDPHSPEIRDRNGYIRLPGNSFIYSGRVSDGAGRAI